MKYLLCIIALVSFASCRPEEKLVPVKKAEPKWVLNSRMSEDGSLWVAVAYSVPPDEVPARVGSREWMEALMIDSLKVEVEFAGIRRPLEREAKGIYVLQASSIPAGTVVGIHVFDQNGKEKLTAQTTVQEQPWVSSINAVARVRTADTLCEVDLTLKKQQGRDAWYLVSFGKTSEIGRMQQGRPSLGKVLSDRSFMQERAVLVNPAHFHADSFHLKREMKWLSPSDTLLVSVARLEKPYYGFVDAMLRSSGWLNQLLGDAVNFPGNVEGGLGYFTLHRSEVSLFIMRNRIR